MTPRPGADAGPASDESLMSALAAGHDPALDELMLRWQRPLQSFLHRHLRNEADALDLAQETFVRLYRHRAHYRPGARFSTWMFQIALNLARDHARKTTRRRTDSLDAADPATVAGLASSNLAPDAAARHAEEVAAVRAALEELPESLRAVVLLAEYEHLPHIEIAAIVGATPKAVENRLARAREKLRASLAPWLRR
jgi:RNA polymerase sigma-70 factor (ECF subfamily)